MGIEEQLLAMKRQMDSLAQKRDRAKWQREAKEKELHEVYGLKTEKAALAEVKRLGKLAEDYEKKAVDGLAKLREEHRELLEMGT